MMVRRAQPKRVREPVLIVAPMTVDIEMSEEDLEDLLKGREVMKVGDAERDALLAARAAERKP